MDILAAPDKGSLAPSLDAALFDLPEVSDAEMARVVRLLRSAEMLPSLLLREAS